MWIRLRCRLESDLDVFRPDYAQERIIPICAIVVQRLIYDIPGIALTFPVTGLMRNMGFESKDETLTCPVPVRGPISELGVPDQIMTTEKLV